MRGEKTPYLSLPDPLMGSPPRARGKEQRSIRHRARVGITPARAGKRKFFMCITRPLQDHPRACGEKRSSGLAVLKHVGSPPRVRGKVVVVAARGGRVGITPARAGKSCSIPLSSRYCRDHPRACGEKVTYAPPPFQIPGSPPRVRGKAPSHSS